jgi:D-alanyl-lipoteichoic acid acyltransferase DltB (MBOAT superfamily)
MSFTSYSFLLLVLLALPLHWLVRRQPARLWVLLLASAVFYAYRHPPSLLLLAATVVLNHAAGLWQARARSAPEPARRRLLGAVIAADLLPLLVFKYGAFLWSGVSALRSLGGARPALLDPLPLPLGISFFTFQVIAYQVDVFRGEVAPEPSLLRFAVFKSFFAQLVAGPIVRARELLPQLQTGRPFDAAGFHQGLFCVAAGLCLKLGVADVLRQFADDAFAHAALQPAQLATSAAWAGLFAYSAQLFADFWGYSTIAVGLGLLFGLALPINFRAPYLSSSLQEFWRRWHVTLSIWFRDYVYLPLGGNRTGRTTRNLVLTMGLAGLWHGAGLRFVAWGLLHGVWLAAERAVARRWPGRPRLPGPLATLLVFVGVSLLWVPFRAPDSQTALAYAARLLLPPYSAAAVPGLLWGVWLGFALLHAPLTRLLDGRRFVALPVWLQTALTGALLLWALALAGAQVDFVYFAF